MEVGKMSTADVAGGLRVEFLISFFKPSLMEERARYYCLIVL
jgi:hypothetical protein